MTEVNFYNETEDTFDLKFSVIVSAYNGKWVFCKHRQRSTYEIPGGHIEEGETATAAAIRELTEETGAVDFNIYPVCVYSVKREIDEESYGMLYYAEISEFEKELKFEIESIGLFEQPPKGLDQWTYPYIQPKLLDEVIRRREVSDDVQ